MSLFTGVRTVRSNDVHGYQPEPLCNCASLRIHLKPGRSIFSNALNFCRSAIASLVRSP